jgi:hypothetical protein
MKRLYTFMVMLFGLNIFSYAQMPDHHAHPGTTEVRLNYELLDFKNSVQKEDGKRYGIMLDHHEDKQHYQMYVEHTDTNTKPVLPKDLSVDKIAFKYQYDMDKAQRLSLTYLYIDDNLANEVDNGKIYGIGYKYKAFSLMQYISDYKRFNVYQSDLKWGMKKKFSELELKGAIIGKYIRLQNRQSNAFSAKAEEEYFTVGMKLHATYNTWHIATAGYTGDRIFAVMNEGLGVQHHAMAFEKTYMFSVGKEFDDFFVNLRYIKQFATEVPSENEGVEVSNIALNLSYKF